MGKNDVLALEANFDTWQKSRMPGLGGVDPFEYYCVDQFIKQYAISDDELLPGLTGGANDGGIDAGYFFANRRLVQEDTIFDSRSSYKVNLLFFQVKQNEGFSPVEINKFVLFSDDLLDLSRLPTEYKTTYNSKVLELMEVFKEKYQEIAGGFPEVFIDYYYITKADVSPNKDAKGAASRVLKKAKKHLSNARCEFHFINAEKLWTQVQLRTPKSKALQWQDTPLQTPEGWVGLVTLNEYWKFLQDEHGDIHERIFESNVRGFQQNTPVNTGIKNTLDKPGKADFWMLNNGITILAAKANAVGYKKLEIDDPQIVNGLQTSRQIFSYFKEGQNVPNSATDARRIMVRVIQSSDETVRGDVIRATNSQNKMPAEALRATDRIHSQIETVFLKNDLYYDRRKGQYKDEGKPIAKIVPVIELLQAMIAITLRQPDDARARPRDYIKDDQKYTEVFGEDKYDLKLYLNCLKLLRKVNIFISNPSNQIDIGHQRNLKFYLAMYVVSVHLADPNPPRHKLLQIDLSKIDDSMLANSYDRIWKLYQKLGKKLAVDEEIDYDSLAKGPHLLKAVNTQLKRRYPNKH
jgi:hypothetical protein